MKGEFEDGSIYDGTAIYNEKKHILAMAIREPQKY